MDRAIWFVVTGLVGMLALGGFLLWSRHEPPGWQADDLVDHERNHLTRRYRLAAEDGGSHLYMLCKPGEPIAVRLVADQAFGPAPRARARLEFDDSPASEADVGVTDTRIDFADAGAATSPAFVERLAASRRFAVELPRPPSDSGFAARFETTGADDVLADLREYCTSTDELLDTILHPNARRQLRGA